MPRIHRRFAHVRAADLENLSRAQLDQLKHGRCLNFLPRKFADVDELRAAWAIHRDTILPEFIAEHPGCRPFGWWLCEHGKERPIVNLSDHALPTADAVRRDTFGFLHGSIAVPVNGEMVTWQEPEHEYLRRHDLLTPEELAHPDLESEAL